MYRYIAMCGAKLFINLQGWSNATLITAGCMQEYGCSIYSVFGQNDLGSHDTGNILAVSLPMYNSKADIFD